MVDPVTGGLIVWVCGKLGDSVLKHLPGDRQLAKQIDKAVAQWAKSLPKCLHVNPEALFPAVDPSTAKTERPEYCALQATLVKSGLPKTQTWHAVFLESWQCVRDNVEEPQPFFRLEESEASEHLEQLAEAAYAVCLKHEPIFKQAVSGTLSEIDGKIDDIREYLREVLELREGLLSEKLKALWPEVSLPLGGPKVSEPFAGREEELESLTDALRGDRTVVAVVGMAGQGKSCLVGEWYDRRKNRPPQGVGLIWRKVYESGYTFDRFVDDLHLYLTGERIDRQALTTIEARTQVVEAILRDKPCWIVLDGVERWLNRWVAEPDAGIEGLTADDRAGQDPVFDKFLNGASFWDRGSRLLLTTRAAPSALDENPPVRVGRRCKPDELLAGLKPADAARLLTKLGVKGSRTLKRQAAQAYGFHPYAVHVLGVLIHDLYGGDVSRWEEVNPFDEPTLEGLFERMIEHRSEDLELLELIACSVGPAPVRMLCERIGQAEREIRRNLAELAKWQMVEFDKDEAGQHTVVRKFLTERMGAEKARETQKAIAAWWAEQEVPARPDMIDEIRPILRAVQHLLAAGHPKAATGIFFSKPSPESYYTPSAWLRIFGYLDENLRIHAEAIRVYVVVIEEEGRRELRNDLASCYNNRGNAYRIQGKLSEAIADYGRAIGIYEQLVEKEGRRELRNDLAMCYNNRGVAYRIQGKLSEAIADYGRAIEIYEQLVEKEGRRELRNDLESSLFNRAVARTQTEEWKEACADIDKGGGLLRELIGEGQRHVLGSIMQTAGFRCAYAKQLGDVAKASHWANDAMRWFVEEVRAGRGNEMLLKAPGYFAGRVAGNLKVLLKNGLDKELWERFREVLGEAGS